MLDFPDFTAVQCLRYSREIMKGKGAPFLSGGKLYSFVFTRTSYLLYRAVLVTPYANTTFSNFYLELINYRNRHNL